MAQKLFSNQELLGGLLGFIGVYMGKYQPKNIKKNGITSPVVAKKHMMPTAGMAHLCYTNGRGTPEISRSACSRGSQWQMALEIWRDHENATLDVISYNTCIWYHLVSFRFF